MRTNNLHLLITRILVIAGIAGSVFFAGCNGNATAGSSGDSPTEAYKRLYAAVKSKNTEAIKKEMSKKTIDFAQSVAARQNTPIEKVFENGFTATTFSPSLPEYRDERVNENMGAVEVYNSKDSRWEDLPFVKEDGAWKLAVGDLFADTWKSPGKGRAAREQEASNSASNNMIPVSPNTNGNSNINAVRPIVPKLRLENTNK